MEGLDLPDFLEDRKTYSAVMHNLMIMGEAIRHIPEDFKRRFPLTDWRSIIGLRNIIVHEYFGINRSQIWHIIHERIPSLRNQMKDILNDESCHPDLTNFG